MFLILVIDIICMMLMLIGIIMLISVAIIGRKSGFNLRKINDEEFNFCILIPARDESKVISKLLDSIKHQSYEVDMKNVYVIVEDSNDKTVSITKKYGANIFVRESLMLKRKGYALDECVRYILRNNKKYDAYFIFDADNILDENYIKEMYTSYQEGYDIVTGYRNTKNGNDNVISACSSVTFSMINEVFNKLKVHHKQVVTISGTGYFIRGSILEKLKEFPFNTLTEDYEMTLYASLHNLKTYYNENAIFYDEQPTKLKDTINQRTRWVKGYIEARKKYELQLLNATKDKRNNFGSKYLEVIGVIPYAMTLIGFLLAIISSIILSIIYFIGNNPAYVISLIQLSLLIFILYTSLVLFTIFIITKDKKINLTTKSKIKAVFYNPIFILTYFNCLIKAVSKKNVEWKKIDHSINKIE